MSVLTRCQLPLPKYLLADEKHSHCLTEKVYLPTGRVIWHLGYTEAKTADAVETVYGQFQQTTVLIEPEAILTDGFESTRKSLRTLFPGASLGNCLPHATNRIGSKLKSVPQSVWDAWRDQFARLFDDRTLEKEHTVKSLGHWVINVIKLRLC